MSNRRGGVVGRAAFDAHYARVRTDPDVTSLAIDEDDTFVGMIASFTIDGDRELTYWVDPGRWGRGIASGAVRRFIEHETARPLFARVAAHNRGSATVLGRNGYVRIGAETPWADGAGKEVLEHIYRLDWSARCPRRRGDHLTGAHSAGRIFFRLILGTIEV